MTDPHSRVPRATPRPIPRSAGQLSDAAPARPRGSIAAEVRATWWYSASGLMMLIVAAHALPFVPAVGRGETGVARITLLAVACAVSAGMQSVFIGGMREGLGGGVRRWPVAGAMLVLGGAILAIAAPLQWSALPLIIAASLVFCLLPHRVPWVLAAITGAAIAVEYLAQPADSGRDAASFFLHAIFPATTWATVWAWDVVRRVDDARATESRLAVARERLRFAADLHDIQGHSLQVIALKAELAERLLAKDPTAATAQIAEIRALAADAMGETRELVQGYRAPALDEELANARDVLAAAGFTARLDAAVLPDDAAVRAVFGRVLREATTNVLRHAAPGEVDIAIADRGGAWSLTVGNAMGAAATSSSEPGRGSGLAGLRERLRAAGGELTTLYDAPAPSPGGQSPRFTLTATLPHARDTTTTDPDQEVAR